MQRLYTFAAGLAVGLSVITTASAGETWEYDEERASEVTQRGEMQSRSKQGWRIIDIGQTDRGHLTILGKSSEAETGRDAERVFLFQRSTLDKLVADLDAKGKEGYTVDTVVADDDGYQIVFSRPRDFRREPLAGSSWAFKLVDMGDGSDAADLRRAGDAGWIGMELLRDDGTVYALMYRDAGPGARHGRYDYEYRRVLGNSVADLERAAERHDIVAMVSDGAQLGLLLRRDRDNFDHEGRFEFQIVDGGSRADDIEEALNEAGKQGWKLLDVDEDNRSVRLLMRRPKAD
jgi:hypothetical protein